MSPDEPSDKPATPSAPGASDKPAIDHATAGAAKNDAPATKADTAAAGDDDRAKVASAKSGGDADERTKADAKPKADADKADAKPKADADKAGAKAKSDDDKAGAKAKADADKAGAKAKPGADEEDEERAKQDAKAKAKAEKAAAKQAEEEREAKEKAEREAREAEEELKRPPKAPAWYRTLRADPPAPVRLALALGFIAVLFGVWWFVTRGYDVQMAFNGRTKELSFKIIPSVDRIISVSRLPSPGEVFGSIDTLLDRELSKHIVSTLERVLLGVGMAALVGVVLGVLAASQRGVNAAITPLVIFLRSVPMGAMIPLTLMLFGDGESQKTRFIFLAIVPFVFSDTVKAVSSVPERYIETAQTLGASRWQIIRKVLVPLSLPDIVTSLRFQLGLALGYIMLAEEINTEHGLGKLINGSQRQGIFDHVYLTLFVIAALAFAIDYVLRTAQRGVFRWRRDL